MCRESQRTDSRILNRRTLRRDHRYLSSVLRTGMDILDVGYGTGAITADIARAVGPDGTALGIDCDDANLAGAVQQYGGIENLRFETVDILALGDRFNNRFDIVTAARTIQWISEPQRAISNMKKAAKLGGRVIVLDYNLDETRWEPDAPVDFLRFYGAFLDWRDVNRWDNQMASHLTALFRTEGMVDVNNIAPLLRLPLQRRLAIRASSFLAVQSVDWDNVCALDGRQLGHSNICIDPKAAAAYGQDYLCWRSVRAICIGGSNGNPCSRCCGPRKKPALLALLPEHVGHRNVPNLIDGEEIVPRPPRKHAPQVQLMFRFH